MKSLPDKFPIRYAIIASDNSDDEPVDDFELSERKALWSQFIDYIKYTPLSLDDLSMRYKAVSYRDKYDNMLCILPKLNGTQEWQDETDKSIQKIVPEGLFSLRNGLAFNLTVYSYNGMTEIPIFWKLLNSVKDKNTVLDELKLRHLNYYNSDGITKLTKRKYEQIMDGKTSLWENFSKLNKPSVFYVRIPYSRLWKTLDDGNEGGIISFNEDILDDFVDKIEGEKEPDKKFINVAIARNLEDLILEEIVSLYKVSNFCNNCGKPLPFDCKIKFCPNIPENIECNRKRARIRKKRGKFTN